MTSNRYQTSKRKSSDNLSAVQRSWLNALARSSVGACLVCDSVFRDRDNFEVPVSLREFSLDTGSFIRDRGRVGILFEADVPGRVIVGASRVVVGRTATEVAGLTG